jgi:hypothetical protein
MSAACATQIDDDAKYRLRVLAGMQTPTFKELFHGEFDILRKAINTGDREGILTTIEALEGCAVDVCEQYDEQLQRAEEAEAKITP